MRMTTSLGFRIPYNSVQHTLTIVHRIDNSSHYLFDALVVASVDEVIMVMRILLHVFVY